jgi:ribosomal protein L34E
MNKKYNYKVVKKFIEDNHCILLTPEFEYNSTKDKINIKCACNNIFITTFTNFKNKNKRQCDECGLKNLKYKKMFSYEYVKEFIESNSGCLLISNTYIGIKNLLDIQCECGNIFQATFDTFIHQNKRQCNECGLILKSKNLSKPFEEVKNYIEKYDCKLLTNLKEYKNSKTKLKIQCICKSVFEVTFNHFYAKKFKQCKNCVKKKKKYNKQTNYNEVKKYIESFNGYQLISTNYINSNTDLEIKCPENHIFLMKYGKFKQGHRCAICGIKLRSNENHWNWKGGISKERDVIKATEQYKEWRNKVFQRDNYTCQCCGNNQSNNLEAHHILNFSEYIDLRFNINNGITLCKDCHNPNKKGSFHNICGTKNNTKEQLAKFIKNYNNIAI